MHDHRFPKDYRKDIYETIDEARKCGSWGLEKGETVYRRVVDGQVVSEKTENGLQKKLIRQEQGSAPAVMEVSQDPAGREHEAT